MPVHDQSLRELTRGLISIKTTLKEFYRHYGQKYLPCPANLVSKVNTLSKKTESLLNELRLFERPERRKRSRLINLNVEECNRLMRLNAMLREKEIFLVDKCGKLQDSLFVNVMHDKDKYRLWDYEFELAVAFILDESDPEWDDGSDNFVANLHNTISVDQFDESDHNDLFLPEGHILNGAPHCWLFHSLYDHVCGPSIEWDDILRIGSVWIDIQVWHQYLWTLK